MDCGCNCHIDTGGNHGGCNLCLLSHQQPFPPEIYTSQTVIDYTPAMLGKLDKMIELLEKILVEVEMLKKEDRNE